MSGRDINFSDLCVLLVEDQLLIALDVEDMLRAIGVKTTYPASSADEGLQILSSTPPGIAILDINLGIGTSIPIADALAERKIPFIFATGYSDSALLPERLKSVPIVRKPYSEVALKSALSQALADVF